MFGYNTISIDQKHRFSIPAKYRADFLKTNETELVVTKDPQYPSLKVYKGSEWKNIS
jgi:MraZ protein